VQEAFTAVSIVSIADDLIAETSERKDGNALV
jgi:hypothetical protein